MVGGRSGCGGMTGSWRLVYDDDYVGTSVGTRSTALGSQAMLVGKGIIFCTISGTMRSPENDAWIAT
jgi:hypothetical protein